MQKYLETKFHNYHKKKFSKKSYSIYKKIKIKYHTHKFEL